MNPVTAKKVVVKVTMMKVTTKTTMEKENIYLRKNPPRQRIPVIRNEFCTTKFETVRVADYLCEG